MSSAVVQAMVAGNAAVSRGTPADLAEARTAFEQAIKLDERYAPAHAGLTLALVRIADAGTERPGAVLPKAIEHGDLAVELDPASALGWYAKTARTSGAITRLICSTAAATSGQKNTRLTV